MASPASSTAPPDRTPARSALEALVEALRLATGVPADWQYTVERVPAARMPFTYGRCSWDYLPNRQFHIELRDDLAEDELRWILAHELWESLLSGLGELTADVIAQLYGPKGARPNSDAALLLHRRDAELRDELVEKLVRLTLGEERPRTLTTLYHQG